MRTHLIMLLITFLSVNLIAQEKITLQDAIRIGLQNNYSIKISTLEKDKSENALNIGTSAFLPSLDLQINQNNTNNNVKQSFYDGREVERAGAKGNSIDGNITANWTVFDGLGMFIDYDILQVNNKISQLNLKKKSEDLVAQIILAYNDLFYLKDQLSTIKKNLDISRFRFNILNIRKEAGKASGMELIQAEIDLNNDIADSIEFFNNYLLQKSEFNLLLGEDISKQFEISDSMKIISKEFNFFELKNNLKNNTEIMLADLGIEITINERKRLESNYLPSINVYGGYNYSSLESQSGLLKSNTTNGLNYGVSLNMNLFEGFRNKTLIENKDLETEITKLNKEDLKKIIEKELKFFIDSYNSNQNILIFQEKNLQLSQKSLEIAKEKLQIGTISQIEFREIQQKYFDALQRHLLIKINLKNIDYSIQKTLGNLIK